MNLPYTIWKVGDKELKLRLDTRRIVELEKALGGNLMNMISKMMDEEGGFKLPPLQVLTVIIHAALQKYEHGHKMDDVYDLIDEYFAAGNDQTQLLTDIYIPLLQESGILPKDVKAKKETAPKLEAVSEA